MTLPMPESGSPSTDASNAQLFRPSPQQERLLALLAADPAFPAHAAVEVRIEGAVDRARVERALARLVERWEVLRTRLDGPHDAARAAPAAPTAPTAPTAPVSLAITPARAPRLAVRAFDLGAPGAAAQVRAELAALAAAVDPLAAEVAALWLHDGDQGRLLLALPALASDASALALIVRELAALDRDEAVAEPVQYADLAAFAHEFAESAEGEVARDYWRRGDWPEAGDGEPVPAPARSDDEALAHGRVRLDDAFVGAPALGRARADWLALWGAFAARLARARAVAVAVATAGRRFEEIAGALGLLDRHLPVTLAIAPELPWRQLAERAERLTEAGAERLEGYDDRLGPGRGEPPIVGFAFEHRQSVALSHEAAGGARFSVGERIAVVDRFGEKLIVDEGDGAVALELWHEGLDPAAAESRLAAFRDFAAAAFARPEARLDELETLSAAERAELDRDRAANRRERDEPAFLHHLVALAARRTPAAIAVSFAGGQLTYRELDRAAGRLSARLAELGVAPGGLVGLAAERGPELLIALLAVLDAGAAYLPLDPGLPADRLRFLVDDARPDLILADEGSEPAGGPFAGVRVEPLGRLVREAMAGGSERGLGGGADLASSVGPEAPAYAIYTSGSTGRPKGVLVPHRAIANRLLWMRDAFPLEPGDAVLWKTPASFDASIWEIFAPLLAGARLAIAAPHGHQDPAYLAAEVVESEISILQLVPSHLAAMLDEPGTERWRGRLRRLFCGGEALPAEAARRALERFGAPVCNLYGPTEAAIDATFGPFDPADGAAVAAIGRALANVDVHLVDPLGGRVPAGVAGEIWIGGVGVAIGYLGRPEATAERFTPDPFGGEPGARVFRTGDLARRRRDGHIDFLGRGDHQVKLRGYRIELQEVEAALERVAGVRRAAVAARRDARGQLFLAAYLVAVEGTAVEAVRAALVRDLPDYMVPSTFTFLDRLPTTPSGKLDRAALPAARTDREEGPALSSVAEQVVAAIWAEVFDRPVDAGSDFFELGGNSLLATQVTSRVRQTLAVDLPIRALFETPTLRAYAARLDGAGRGAAFALSPLAPAARDRPLPLSYAQQRLWFLDQLERGGPSYNLPLAVRLLGALRVDLLAAAFAEVVARHEVLRTTIETERGVPAQRVHPVDPLAAGAGRARMPEADLSALPAGVGEREARRAAAAEARQPFDLALGPLARAACLRLAADEALILFTLHHLVSDGWSLGILAREVGEAYRARRAGEAPRFSPLPVQYADYAVWQRELLDGDGGRERLAEAARRLVGAPQVLDLPFDRPRPAMRSYRGGRSRFALPAEAPARLAALARSEAATPFMAAFAAFFAWLSRQSGLGDFVVGTPFANRSRPEIEPLIGFFVNTLVIRAAVDPAASFNALLGAVREATFAAALYEDVPFERLVDAVQPERSLSHTPLFQILFAYQNAPAASVALSGLAIEALDLHSATSKFDLTLELIERPGATTGVLEYSTDLFDRATAERFAASLALLFEGAARDPEAPLAALPLLAPAERHAALFESGSDPAPARPSGTIGARIAAVAAERPEAVAAIAGGVAITYGELIRRADRLAARLADLGAAGAEARVGLLLDRSVELVIAIVGVLRAGAAYVPLDPDYPSDRLAFLLGDSGVRALVVDRPVPDGLAVEVPCLDLVAALADGADPGVSGTASPEVDSSAAAYVIYTSGSTGKPKGVVVSHANVLRLFSATADRFAFAAADVWSFFHSQAFDFSVWEIFGALLHGARLLVVPRMVARSSEEFHALLDAERVTMLSQTPSAFRQLAAVEQSRPSRQLALRAVVFGGEALDLAALTPWWRRFGPDGPRLVNMYGITETTVHVTYRALGAADFGARSLIGGPIPDLSLRLLDGAGELAPVGVIAEIHVGGLGVARGYSGRPDLTAERFVPDPFAALPGERLYRSGDLARRLPNGDLEFLGRRDHQVKVRGFRIELGEIEAALAAHADVRGALALLRRDLAGEARLVAYVASDRSGGEFNDELRATLRRALPDHMQPAAIVLLGEFPLTAHGKVDRGALPLPSHERPDLATTYAAPETPTEAALATAWTAVLGLDRVGVDDNFFALGGDSMRIVQAVARAREAGFSFAVQDLYQHQTIRSLAGAVDAAAREPVAPVAPAEDDLDALVAEVEGLSEEEVRALIEQRLRALGMPAEDLGG